MPRKANTPKKLSTVKARAPARKPNGVKLNTQKPALSPAHRAVIDAWFDNGCVSQRRAMTAVGYSEKTAVGNPHSVFQREDVKAEIARRQQLRSDRRDVTEQRIIDEYAKLAFSNLGDLLEVNEDGSAYMDFNKLTDDQKSAMAEYQVETYEERESDGEGGVKLTPVKKARVKFSSKQAALDSLARIKGMFKDKVEVSGGLSLVEKVQQARQRLAAAKTDVIA